MVIGIDFDNTIVSYDRVFHLAAAEWGYEVSDVAVSKTAVRDHMRALGDEEKWIELQGYVYGKKMIEAEPFDGVLEFFSKAKKLGVELRIISHKTKHPFAGPQYDLHEATRHWLDILGLADSSESGIGKEAIFLELTKDAKAARIASEGCDVFIDDLPEFLSYEGIPNSVRKVLFDPSCQNAERWTGDRVDSWAAFSDLVFD